MYAPTMRRKVQEEIVVGDTRTEVFDFSQRLLVWETLTAASVIARVYAGVDPEPEAVIAGIPGMADGRVEVDVTSGVVGVTYRLTARVTTSEGQQLKIQSYLTTVDVE